MRPTVTVLVSLFLAAVGGCARRSITVTSEPSGALVWINGEETGRTPFLFEFDEYGDFDVVVRKDGYETLKTHRNVKAPLALFPPFDLFGELFGAKDHREWSFQLHPMPEGPADSTTLINRGEAMREDLHSSKYTREPSTQPATRSATQPSTRPKKK